LKRVVIVIIGGTVPAIGLVMLVLSGPAFLEIPGKLAILAVE
jgi:Putative transmembrane protein (PGPGW)